MSQSNGVVRIGRKGLKKFAFGEEGTPGSEPFELDVVITFHEWLAVDEQFFTQENPDGGRSIPRAEIPAYDATAIAFVEARRFGNKQDPEYVPVSAGEARDFMARLREAYDELADFFVIRSREKRDSPDTSAAPSAQLLFSVEEPAKN